MNKLVIFVFVLSLMSFFVCADEFNLQASVNNNEVTLTWNNVLKNFEEDMPVENLNPEVVAPNEPEDSNNDLGSETVNPGETNNELPLVNINPGASNPGENQPIVPEPVNPDSNAITTQAIVNQGFFSKIFNSIINTFKNIFGLKTVGVSIGDQEYIVYKIITYASSLSNKEIIIKQGSLSEFNCEETCSYTYTEKVNGIYNYAVASAIDKKIKTKSEEKGPIEIKPLSDETNIECSDEVLCIDPEKECDLTTNKCVPKAMEEETTTCIADSECKLEEECDLTTNKCVLKTVEKECDEVKKCDDGKECNSENKCVDKVIKCDFQGGCPLNYICKTDINTCIITNNVEQQCQSNENCEEGKKCVEGKCEIILVVECETNKDINTVQTQACLFDIGICQKQGQKKKTCIKENNELKWNDFGACEPIEKCNIGSDCESGICDTDIHSCLPAEFEGSENGEVSCEDSLDNDCDGVSDCEDEDCDCFVPNDNPNNLDTNPSSPNSSSGTGSSGGQNNNNLPKQQDIPRNIEYVDSSREGLDELGNERDVSGRFQDAVGNAKSSKNEGSSLLTIIITFITALIFGAGGIYFYLFKFKKYKKQDIIMWVEHCRERISEGKSIDDVIKEMRNYNLPQDFMKIVMNKLK